MGVVGLAENKANSVQMELESGLSLAKRAYTFHHLKNPLAKFFRKSNHSAQQSTLATDYQKTFLAGTGVDGAC